MILQDQRQKYGITHHRVFKTEPVSSQSSLGNRWHCVIMTSASCLLVSSFKYLAEELVCFLLPNKSILIIYLISEHLWVLTSCVFIAECRLLKSWRCDQREKAKQGVRSGIRLRRSHGVRAVWRGRELSCREVVSGVWGALDHDVWLAEVNRWGSFITQKVKSANITSNANQTLNDELRTHSYKPFKYVYQFIVIYTFPDDTLRIVLQLDGDFITSPHHVSARPPLSPPHILESSVHFMLSWFKG